MEDPGRLGLQHWAMDHNHLKDHLKDHPALKLMDVIGERDAAVLERNTAIAERKMAYAERDAALLQRDVAYADRNAALMERDAAVAALAMVRVEGDPRQGSATEAASKLMQMVNMAVGCPTMEAELQTVPRGNTEMGNTLEVELQTVPRGTTEMGNILDATQSLKQGKQEKKAPKDNARKRKAPVQASHDSKRTKSSSKRKRKQQASQEPVLTVDKPKQDQGMKASNSLLFDCTTLPIPYCSCTGMNQQCYRWGNGGWQSACCTNFVSMYPLPMNPNKRGSRLPGRKMSGGAFKKILGRLAGEGVNISDPLDLKNHWAKHGTNRYVTKK